MDDGSPFPAKMTLVHGRALLTSWENLVLVVNLMLESKGSNVKQRRLLIRVLPKLQCYEADLGRSKDTEINQIKNVRQRCPQTIPIKEGWLPLPHFPRHASAGGSYFKCHLQLYFYLKFYWNPRRIVRKSWNTYSDKHGYILRICYKTPFALCWLVNHPNCIWRKFQA